jgi:hypothetical protein
MIAVRLKPAVLRLPKPAQLPVLVLLVRALVLPHATYRLLVLPARALVLPHATHRLLVLLVRALVLPLATHRLLVLPERALADRLLLIAERLVLPIAVLLPSAANNLAATMIRAKLPN